MVDRTAAPDFKQIQSFSLQKAESFFLNNGIPVHLIKGGVQPVIRIEFIFKAGRWFEPKNGLSLITTKLLSAGTKGKSSEEIEEEFAGYGAFIDLSAGQDLSTFSVYCLSRHLPGLLPLCREIITEAEFPEEEISRLKHQALENLKVNQKKTSYLASTGFRQKLFGNDFPYGRVVKEEDILKINRDDLLSFYHSAFHPGNCEIVIAGLPDEDTIQHLQKEIGHLKTPDRKPAGYKGNISKAETGRTTIKKEGSLQSSIRMGLPMPDSTHPDYLNLLYATEIFGGYFGSRLMKKIREEKGFTYGISAHLISFLHAGHLIIGTDVNKENTEETIEEVFSEIKKLKEEAIPPIEMETVRNYMTGNFINSLTTPFALAEKFKTVHYSSLDYSFYDRLFDSIQNMTIQQVRNTVRDYFKEEDFLIVTAG